MDEQQTFQKPWQIALINFHAKIEKVIAPIERFLSRLSPNTAIFQAELDRKPLKSIK